MKEAAPQATPRTIKKVLRAIGYLSDPLTTAQIAKSTGINQTRLEPIIRDLFDSQLIDWDLDWPETKHRRGRPRQSKPSPSEETKHLAAYLDDLRQTMRQTKRRRPADLSHKEVLADKRNAVSLGERGCEGIGGMKGAKDVGLSLNCPLISLPRKRGGR